jgi:hypothetical protein
MRNVLSLRLLALLLVSLVANAGCANVWGFDDLTLGHADGGEAGDGAGPVVDGGGFCVANDPADCSGKCGQLKNRCGSTIDCGGCTSGTCGGGGPNVCGSAPCMPSCTNKACGASDGCQGLCGSGSCPGAGTCVANACVGVCDPSCNGCCSSTGSCVEGNSDMACGSGGSTCAVCTASQTCGENGCVPRSASGGPAVVLFGGQAAMAGTFFGDTWMFDGSRWTAVGATGPSARGAASMATLGTNTVLFGGYDGNYRNDTWSFDGTSWTQVSQQGGPPPRTFASMATLGPSVVLFGGYDGTYRNDTWTFDGTRWHEVNVASPPPGRQAPNLATLDVSTIVLFGGTDSSGAYLNDTWTFDGSSWTQVPVIGQTPPGRYIAAMASLGVDNEQVVLFGGDDGMNAPLGDTWTYTTSPGGWLQPNVSIFPPARSLGGMSGFQSSTFEVVLFGGDDANANLLGDTWTFEGQGNWTQQTATPSPQPRDGPAMAFLP